MRPSTKVLALLFALPCLLTAQAAPGATTYIRPAATFSAGGGAVSSGSYALLGVIGQPGIIGSSSGSQYAASHGFLSALGDGFKILYPVIAVDKGVLSFTVANTASAGSILAISNSGGGTLNWSIAKTAAASWLTATPSSGSGAFSVNVTANANGLVVGNTYNDTLVVSGAGIQQTRQILVSLHVIAPASYRLTVTLVSNTPGKGGGSINNGTGLIACANTGNNPATATGSCQADLPPGTSITLLQTPDSDSTLATWSGACTGTGNCTVSNIAANTSTTATFPYSAMAKVNSSGSGYEALSLAYAGAAATDTIRARALLFPAGDLLMNSNKVITLLGGLNAYYATQSGQYSILSGRLVISTGRVTIDRVKIR